MSDANDHGRIGTVDADCDAQQIQNPSIGGISQDERYDMCQQDRQVATIPSPPALEKTSSASGQPPAVGGTQVVLRVDSSDDDVDIDEGDDVVSGSALRPSSAVMAPRKRASAKKRKEKDRVHPWRLGGEPLQNFTQPGERLDEFLTTPRSTRAAPPSRLTPNLGPARQGYDDMNEMEEETACASEFVCMYCSRTCHNRGGLIRHQNACHSRPTEVIEDEGNGDQPAEQFICDYCPRICKSRGGLSRHQRVCSSRPMAADADDEAVEEDAAQQHCCEYCSKAFPTLRGLTQHRNLWCKAVPVAQGRHPQDEDDGAVDNVEFQAAQGAQVQDDVEDIGPVIDLHTTVEMLRRRFPRDVSHISGVKRSLEKIEEVTYGEVLSGSLENRVRNLCGDVGVRIIES